MTLRISRGSLEVVTQDLATIQAHRLSLEALQRESLSFEQAQESALDSAGEVGARTSFYLAQDGALDPAGDVATRASLSGAADGALAPSGELTHVYTPRPTIKAERLSLEVVARGDLDVAVASAGELSASGELTISVTRSYQQSLEGGLESSGELASNATLFRQQDVDGALGTSGALASVYVPRPVLEAEGSLATSGDLAARASLFRTQEGVLGSSGDLTTSYVEVPTIEVERLSLEVITQEPARIKAERLSLEIVTAPSVYLQSVGGELLVSGGMTRTNRAITFGEFGFDSHISKSWATGLAGSLDFSSIVEEHLYRLWRADVAGDLSFQGDALYSRFLRAVSGDLNIVGDISRIASVSMSLDGSLSFDGHGDYRKFWTKGVDGDVGFAGIIFPHLKKVLSGDVAFSSDIQKSIFFNSPEGALNPEGEIRKFWTLDLNGVLSASSNLSHRQYKMWRAALEGDLSASSSLSHRQYRMWRVDLDGGLLFESDVDFWHRRLWRSSLDGDLDFSGLGFGEHGGNMLAFLYPIGQLRASLARGLEGELGFASDAWKASPKALDGTLGLAGDTVTLQDLALFGDLDLDSAFVASTRREIQATLEWGLLDHTLGRDIASTWHGRTLLLSGRSGPVLSYDFTKYLYLRRVVT